MRYYLHKEDIGMRYYLHGEDLAPGLVGPFPSKGKAEEHLRFQGERGDAAVVVHNNTKVLTEDEARNTWAWANNRCTPDMDREEPQGNVLKMFLNTHEIPRFIHSVPATDDDVRRLRDWCFSPDDDPDYSDGQVLWYLTGRCPLCGGKYTDPTTGEEIDPESLLTDGVCMKGASIEECCCDRCVG